MAHISRTCAWYHMITHNWSIYCFFVLIWIYSMNRKRESKISKYESGPIWCCRRFQCENPCQECTFEREKGRLWHSKTDSALFDKVHSSLLQRSTLGAVSMSRLRPWGSGPQQVLCWRLIRNPWSLGQWRPTVESTRLNCFCFTLSSDYIRPHRTSNSLRIEGRWKWHRAELLQCSAISEPGGARSQCEPPELVTAGDSCGAISTLRATESQRASSARANVLRSCRVLSSALSRSIKCYLHLL